jgi:hypothetical protein
MFDLKFYFNIIKVYNELTTEIKVNVKNSFETLRKIVLDNKICKNICHYTKEFKLYIIDYFSYFDISHYIIKRQEFHNKKITIREYK